VAKAPSAAVTREITAEPDDKKTLRGGSRRSTSSARPSPNETTATAGESLAGPRIFAESNRGFGWQRCGWENRDVATTLPIERGLILHKVDGPFIRVDARASREKSGID